MTNRDIPERIDILIRVITDTEKITAWYVDDKEPITPFSSAFLSACAVVQIFAKHILSLPLDDKRSDN